MQQFREILLFLLHGKSFKCHLEPFETKPNWIKQHGINYFYNFRLFLENCLTLSFMQFKALIVIRDFCNCIEFTSVTVYLKNMDQVALQAKIWSHLLQNSLQLGWWHFLKKTWERQRREIWISHTISNCESLLVIYVRRSSEAMYQALKCNLDPKYHRDLEQY